MGIIDSIMSFFITRDTEKLKKSEKLGVTIKKINKSRTKLDEANKEFTKAYSEYQKTILQARKSDIEVKENETLKKYYQRDILGDLIGWNCRYCNSKIQTHTKKQFCSIKCENEYLRFKRNK